jgi:Protein of unknown function (DUF3037)
VSARQKYDYAIVRVVPRVERGEHMNAGVVLYCRGLGVLAARIELDRARLEALAPGVDMESVERALAVVPLVCDGDPAAGPVAQLTQAERFHWLVAPRSTLIQSSPVHAGFCADPHQALEHLVETMVRPPRP